MVVSLRGREHCADNADRETYIAGSNPAATTKIILDKGEKVMYNRELETNADAHAAHIRNLQAAAAKRIQEVKAKMKLKKQKKD